MSDERLLAFTDYAHHTANVVSSAQLIVETSLNLRQALSIPDHQKDWAEIEACARDFNGAMQRHTAAIEASTESLKRATLVFMRHK